NSFKPVTETTTYDASTSTTLIPGPVTIEEKAKKNNDVKARTFVSSPSPYSTNEVPTVFGVSTATPQVSTANLSDATIDKKLFQKTGKKITINGSDTAGYDKAKVECFNCHKMGHFARECRVLKNHENRIRNQETTRRIVNVEDTSSKALVEIDGASFNWSYMADDEAPTNMAFMALLDSEDIKIKESGIVVLKSKLEKISNEKDALETKIEKFENASQSLDKLIRSQVTNNSNKGLGYVSYNVIPPPYTGRFSPPRIDLSHTGLPEFAEPSVRSYRVKPIEVVTHKSSVKIYAPVKKTMVRHLLRTGNQMKRIRSLMECMLHLEEELKVVRLLEKERSEVEFKIHSDWDPQVLSEPGLQSVEERLVHYKKNEAVFIEKINVLNLEVKLRDKVLSEYTTNLEKSEKGIDELKLRLEKLQNSSKSLNTLLDSQVRNYMPLKRDLRLMDEHFESESVDVFIVSSSDFKTVKTIDHKGVFSTEEPKTVRKNSFGLLIIEDWHSDDDSEDKLSPTVEVKTVKPSVEKIKYVKTDRETVKIKEYPKQHKHHPRGNQRN
nr:hypothetical protein [Tanacetum cinerariifolium]